MIATGFVVAMAANIALARHDAPSRIVQRASEWLIVSRWGAEGEFLTISTTTVAPLHCRAAPVGLTPHLTRFGLLLSENQRQRASAFLLLRQLPAETVIAGAFAPADGYVRLVRRGHTLRLRAEGRDADSFAYWHGLTAAAARAGSPEAETALAWHIDALRRPWFGEFREGAATPPGQ